MPLAYLPGYELELCIKAGPCLYVASLRQDLHVVPQRWTHLKRQSKSCASSVIQRTGNAPSMFVVTFNISHQYFQNPVSLPLSIYSCSMHNIMCIEKYMITYCIIIYHMQFPI